MSKVSGPGETSRMNETHISEPRGLCRLSCKAHSEGLFDVTYLSSSQIK